MQAYWTIQSHSSVKSRQNVNKSAFVRTSHFYILYCATDSTDMFFELWDIQIHDIIAFPDIPIPLAFSVRSLRKFITKP